MFLVAVQFHLPVARTLRESFYILLDSIIIRRPPPVPQGILRSTG